MLPFSEQFLFATQSQAVMSAIRANDSGAASWQGRSVAGHEGEKRCRHEPSRGAHEQKSPLDQFKAEIDDKDSSGLIAYLRLPENRSVLRGDRLQCFIERIRSCEPDVALCLIDMLESYNLASKETDELKKAFLKKTGENFVASFGAPPNLKKPLKLLFLFHGKPETLDSLVKDFDLNDRWEGLNYAQYLLLEDFDNIEYLKKRGVSIPGLLNERIQGDYPFFFRLSHRLILEIITEGGDPSLLDKDGNNYLSFTGRHETFNLEELEEFASSLNLDVHHQNHLGMNLTDVMIMDAAKHLEKGEKVDPDRLSKILSISEAVKPHSEYWARFESSFHVLLSKVDPDNPPGYLCFIKLAEADPSYETGAFGLVCKMTPLHSGSYRYHPEKGLERIHFHRKLPGNTLLVVCSHGSPLSLGWSGHYKNIRQLANSLAEQLTSECEGGQLPRRVVISACSAGAEPWKRYGMSAVGTENVHTVFADEWQHQCGAPVEVTAFDGTVCTQNNSFKDIFKPWCRVSDSSRSKPAGLPLSYDDSGSQVTLHVDQTGKARKVTKLLPRS